MKYDKAVRIIDTGAFLMMVGICAVPTSRIPLGSNSSINVEAFAMLFLAGLLAARLLLRRDGPSALPFLLAVIMSALGWVMGPTIGRASEVRALQHLITYVPFLLACLLLWTGTSIHYRRILIGFAIAAGLGSIVSAYLFFFNPLALIRALHDTPEAERMVSWGRLPWQQAPFAPLALLSFLVPENSPKWLRPVLLISSIAVVMGLIATFSRTLLAGLILFLLFTGMASLYLKRASIFLKIVVLVGSLIAIALVVVPLDQRVQNLVEYRVLGIKTESTDTVFSQNDVDIRRELFAHYKNRLKSYWFYGQGLGVSYTDVPEETYSDVTLISFWLPFGVTGILTFAAFILIIWKKLRAVFTLNPPLTLAIMTAVVTGLFISLNDDIWSHKSYVLLLTYLVVSLFNKGARESSESTNVNNILPMSKKR